MDPSETGNVYGEPRKHGSYIRALVRPIPYAYCYPPCVYNFPCSPVYKIVFLQETDFLGEEENQPTLSNMFGIYFPTSHLFWA